MNTLNLSQANQEKLYTYFIRQVAAEDVARDLGIKEKTVRRFYSEIDGLLGFAQREREAFAMPPVVAAAQKPIRLVAN